MIGTIVCALAVFSPALVTGENAQPSSAVVILRNGNVLRGQVTNLGDRYQVKLASGGQVQIPSKKIDFVCSSIDQAYRRKRDASAVSIRRRLDLAQWCIRVKLYDRAADQLLVVRNLDPRSRQLRQLQQRLVALVEQQQGPANSAAASSTTATQRKRKKYQHSPLPTGSLQQFTLTIQPILLNRCSANGCHGNSTTSKFKLIRPARGYLLKRRATQRNLQATLRWVDRANPLASPLVTLPNGPHGTAKTAIFDGRLEAEQRKRLIDWVRSLGTKEKRAVAPPAIKKDTATLSQPMNQIEEDDIEAQLKEYEASFKPGTFKAKDPFDPEIFNRKFFPSKRPQVVKPTTPAKARRPLDPRAAAIAARKKALRNKAGRR